jgi:hypothetical protein
MGSQLPPILQFETQEHSDSTGLIKEWLYRFGVNFREDVAPLLPLWLETFRGIDPKILDRLFRRAIRTCKFFPRVADILEPLNSSTVALTEADLRWQKVLEFCRQFVSPDVAGGIFRGAPNITQRTMTAICAAGGLQWIRACPENELQWSKKRFIESYTAWETLKQDEYLLPDGEIKTLVSEFAQTKMLPATSQDWSECRVRGAAYRAQLATQGAPDLSPEQRVRIADELAAAARKVLDQPSKHVVTVSDQTREALRRQAEIIKSRYPTSDTPQPLRRYILEPAAPIRSKG